MYRIVDNVDIHRKQHYIQNILIISGVICSGRVLVYLVRMEPMQSVM